MPNMKTQDSDTPRKPSPVAAARRKQAEREWRKIAREIGSDLARISSDCDNGDSAPCVKLHGRIISVFGMVPGFLTLDDLDIEAAFGGELGHRLEYVDETTDADEIALQKSACAR